MCITPAHMHKTDSDVSIKCAIKKALLSFCHRPEPTNFLIKNNASVGAVDKVNRNTPLHCAVLAGNVDAAHILLEAGGSVEAENINVSFTHTHTHTVSVTL